MKFPENEFGTSSSAGIKLRGSEDLRCQCGNLMALIKPEGIELKCRRCKRKSLIPLKGIAEDVRSLWPELLHSE